MFIPVKPEIYLFIFKIQYLRVSQEPIWGLCTDEGTTNTGKTFSMHSVTYEPSHGVRSVSCIQASESGPHSFLGFVPAK